MNDTHYLLRAKHCTRKLAKGDHEPICRQREGEESKTMAHNVLISIGSNVDGKKQMALARRVLAETFADVRFTRSLTSPACPGNGIYSNMLAEFSTELHEPELVRMLKKLECRMGDSELLRGKGNVMMDLDVLRYEDTKRHLPDWARPYIKRLLRYTMRIVVAFILTLTASSMDARGNSKEVELLGKAIEYFQGGKYHESILAFEKLNKSYKLSPRFMAYLGMSYYKEMQYEDAVRYLTKCLPEMKAYSPYEQAVYTYSCAESLFQLERYTESIKYYELALPLVSGNDRGDVLFHNAFAHYLTQGNTDEVVRLFSEALEAYKASTDTATSLQVARLRQTETMLRGLKSGE